jgi:hypothetical protein
LEWDPETGSLLVSVRQGKEQHLHIDIRICCEGPEERGLILDRMAGSNQQAGATPGQKMRALTMEPESPDEPTDLGQQRERYPPRTPHVVAATHGSKHQRYRPGYSRRQRKRSELEVITADSMVGANGAEVLAIASGTPPLSFEMMDEGSRLIEEWVAGLSPSVGELRLEVIGHTYKVLIEATQAKSSRPRQAEVAAHEHRRTVWFQTVETEGSIAGIRLALMPRLKHTTSDQSLRMLLSGGPMSKQQLGVGNDVIIEEQHSVPSRFLQGAVHRRGNRSRKLSDPTNAASAIPIEEVLLDQRLMVRGLIHNQNFQSLAIKGKQGINGLE